MSLDQFIHMGGYAGYVWSAYGISLLVLVLNVVMPVLGRRRLIRQLSLRQKRTRKRS